MVQEHDRARPGRRADDRQRHDGGLPPETGPPRPGRRVLGAGPGRRLLLRALARPGRRGIARRGRVAGTGSRR